MAHFVNGVEEMRDKCGTDGVGPIPCETPIPYIPHTHGRMSIGVRINQVCCFTGVVAAVRFTPRVLPTSELLRPPNRTAAVPPPPPAAAPTLFEQFEILVYVACGILLAAVVFFAGKKAHAVHPVRCPAGRGCSAAG